MGVQIVFVSVELVDDVMARGEVKVKAGAVWFLLVRVNQLFFRHFHSQPSPVFCSDTTVLSGWRRIMPLTVQRVAPILQRVCQILQ